MLGAVRKVGAFIDYWWFRYLMMTELYMVEKWERAVIHVIFLVIFLIVWLFNYGVLLNVTNHIFGINTITPEATDALLKTTDAFISPQFIK